MSTQRGHFVRGSSFKASYGYLPLETPKVRGPMGASFSYHASNIGFRLSRLLSPLAQLAEVGAHPTVHRKESP